MWPLTLGPSFRPLSFSLPIAGNGPNSGLACPSPLSSPQEDVAKSTRLKTGLSKRDKMRRGIERRFLPLIERGTLRFMSFHSHRTPLVKSLPLNLDPIPGGLWPSASVRSGKYGGFIAYHSSWYFPAF